MYWTEQAEQAIERIYEDSGKRCPPIIRADNPLIAAGLYLSLLEAVGGVGGRWRYFPQPLTPSIVLADARVTLLLSAYPTSSLSVDLFPMLQEVGEWIEDLAVVYPNLFGPCADWLQKCPIPYQSLSFRSDLRGILRRGISVQDTVSYEDMVSIRILGELKDVAGFIFLHEDLAIYTSPHSEVPLDELGRIHCPVTSAVSYPGLDIYAWHGIIIPPWVIEKRDSLRVADVDEERNQEVRNVILQIIGTERYIREADFKLVHEDSSGKLYSRVLPSGESIMVVEVENSTPEPDGTKKKYFLRTHPRMSRARQAVAASFGLQEFEYAPEQES